MVHQQQLAFQTSGHGHLIDITEELRAVIARSRIAKGVAHLFQVGSTAALGAIEFEPGLEADLPATLDRLIPPDADYGHERTWHDGNGHSHLQATLLGPALSVPVAAGSPVLGTWQQVVLLECDTRPRARTVIVTVMGE